MTNIEILINKINNSDINECDYNDIIRKIIKVIYKDKINPAIKDYIILPIKTILLDKNLIYDYISHKYIKIYNQIGEVEVELDDFNKRCVCNIRIYETKYRVSFSDRYLEEYFYLDSENEKKIFYEFNDEGKELRTIVHTKEHNKVRMKENINL